MESRIHTQVKAQLASSGWDIKGILEEDSYSSDGRVYRPDMILLHNLNPVAVVEIKGVTIDAKDALYQILSYLDTIKVPHGFITNGIEIFQVSSAMRELVRIDRFPDPKILWQNSFPNIDKKDPRNINPVEIQVYKPRLYQIEAINTVISAIITGNNYLHVRMSKGTGKTIIALEICWKLIKSHLFKRAFYLTPGDTEYFKEKFSRHDWKVNILSESSKLQSTDVYISTLKEVFTISNIRDLLDRETIILIDAGNFAPGQQKFPSELYKENLNSALVLYTDTELPWELSRLFGNPVFSYSFSESIVHDLLQIPDGFESRKLDEISEIQIGLPPDLIKEGEDDKLVLVYVIKGRDLEKGYEIKIDTLTSIAKKLPGGMLDERFSLRKNDILLSTMPIKGTFSVSLLSGKISEFVTYFPSVIRIRVDPALANPKDVYAYLKSESGQSAIKVLTTRNGTSIPRINVRSLAQLPILFSKNKIQFQPASQVLTQIQEQVIPKLRNLNNQPDDASEINSIAEQLRQMAILLAPLPLFVRIQQSYPMPISLAFRKYKDSRFNVYEQVLRLRDVFEATSFYVYNIVLADTIHRLNPKKFFVEDKGARKAYNSYSMAARLDFVGSVVEIAKENNPNDLFLSELTNTTFVEQAKDFQENFRNRLSHSATAAESQQQMILKDFEPIVMNMLAELEFLTKYRLVRIPAFYYKDGQWMRRMEIYHGTVPEIDEQPVSAESGLTPADKNHLILLDQDDQTLCLYPLYQLLSSKETRNETHLCFFKQRKQSQMLLEGESVQGAFEVKLNGYSEFENLQNRIPESA
jgi:hypothetical protein